jgi:DNA-binding protein HU-beta
MLRTQTTKFQRFYILGPQIFKYSTMGKGDKKTNKGKRWRGTYGNTRRPTSKRKSQLDLENLAKKEKAAKKESAKSTAKKATPAEKAEPAKKATPAAKKTTAKKTAAPKKATAAKKDSKPKGEEKSDG